ncbi:type II secretion system protein GspL [Psychrobacter sp. I-STPA10]|uniref:type II secretion system protein GspL n=1 Tax=Psychrobacter sp. I-STPA10 TaxID=2585769 RepID=UPI001E61B542|nr:type II secretion system protein GspL [Psychrobacter sp. I-STPA10]
MQHVWLSRQPQQDNMLRLWDAQQKTWQWLSDWQAMRAQSSDKNLCLYVPTQAVLSIASELSSAQLKQLGSAGQQYLFEDVSLTPVEQLQVKSLSLADQHYLYALAGAQIEQWQQSAGLADFVVQVILPDFVLLPVPEARLGSQVVIYYDEDTTLMRTSEAAGMGVSYMPSLAAQLDGIASLDEIKLLTTTQCLPHFQDLSDINYTSLHTGDADSFNSLSEPVHQAAAPAVEITTSNDDIVSILQHTGALINVSTEALLPITYPERHPLNMVPKSSESKLSPYLKTTLMVALVAWALQISADALQWYQYQQAETITKLATAEQYAYWFGDEGLNERTTLMAQVKPKLIPAQSTDTSQLGVLSRVAPLLQQSDLVAQSLTWDDTAIHLSVFSEQREGLDQLVSGLTQQGIHANLGSVVPQTNGGLVGELTLPLSSSTGSEDLTTNNS